MPLIYITGPPGAGKTTIQKALQDRGYEAYDIDDPILGGAHHKTSGVRVCIPPADQRQADWFERHEWRTDLAALGRLRDKASSKQIFVCGVTPNDEPVLPLFDKVYYLQINEHTLKQRLTQRDNNDYGKNPNELAQILKRKEALDKRYLESTAYVLDARQDVHRLVHQILVE